MLSNTTDRLVNYELRRKMRRVGVQLQHVGKQLCWQLTIDEPGLALGLAELVHIAKPTDVSGAGVQAPGDVKYPPMKETPFTTRFAFRTRSVFADNQDDADGDETYFEGAHDDDMIDYIKVCEVTPPAVGYEIVAVDEVSISGTDPSKDPPEPVAIGYDIVKGEPTHFQITLREVNFNNQPEIAISVNVLWGPDKKTKDKADAEHQKANDAYNEAKLRIAHQDYLTAVKERVEQAYAVVPRDSDDLRAEERSVVFRRIVQLLIGSIPASQAHVVSELLRAIFDVEGMFYYVAPDWWPRERDTAWCVKAVGRAHPPISSDRPRPLVGVEQPAPFAPTT